ncbi:MAG TPA: DNRLRE domain-containing protein, partial [Thermoplasmatales archaeon]|nr:DNRLRE domain-containing protein [Thermoplasmatales archaeon]
MLKRKMEEKTMNNKKFIRNISSNGQIIGVGLLAFIMAISTFSAILIMSASEISATSTTIWTTDSEGNPQTDFEPEETVYIHGSGFNPGSTIHITVTRPDGSQDVAPDQGRFPDSLPVTDANGSWSYEYYLDGIEGNYTINATDDTNIAQTMFTDWAEPETFRDAGYMNSISVFHPGDIVYARMKTGPLFIKNKLVWLNTSGVIVRDSGWIDGGSGYYDDSYTPNELGTWKLQRWINKSGIIIVKSINFYVIESHKYIPDDVHVDKNSPDTNYANGWRIDYTGGLHVSNCSNGVRETYLKFDLSDIPNNACIYHAKLYMHYNSVKKDDGCNLSVYYITNDSWSEDDITWNDRPSHDGTLQDTVFIPTMSKYYSWNVTNAVESTVPSDDILSLVLYWDDYSDSPKYHKDFTCTEKNTDSTYQGPYLEIFYDDTPPTVTVEFGEPKIWVNGTNDPDGCDNPNPQSWLIGPNTIVWINATDDESGVDYIWYETTPGNGKKVYDGDPEDQDPAEGRISLAFNFSESCWHEIDYVAYDECGYSTSGSTDFYVDATPPTTTFSFEGPIISYAGDSWIGPCTWKWINATDEGCECVADDIGVGFLYIQVFSGGSTQNYNWDHPDITYIVEDNNFTGEVHDLDPAVGVIRTKINITDDCWHCIKHWAVDKLGNKEDTSTGENKQFHKVDATPPESYLSFDGPTCEKPEQGWCIEPFTNINIMVNNVGTPPCIYPETYSFFRVYVANEGKWYPNETGQGSYSGYGPSDVEEWFGKQWYKYDDSRKIQFEEECKHYLEYFAKDPLCNKEIPHNETFFVDESEPGVLIEIGAPQCDENGVFCVNFSTPVNLSVWERGCCDVLMNASYRVTNDDTGVSTGWIPMDIQGDSAFLGYHFSQECNHTIELYAEDCLGNSNYTSMKFHVDEKAPDINKTVGEPKMLPSVYEEGVDYWVTCETPIIINASDLGCCGVLENV